MLPSRLRHSITAFHTTTIPLTAPGSPGTVDPELLTTIAAACRDQQRLRLCYLGRNEVTTRNVEPHHLVHTPRRWYLLAWDTDREDWRIFRIYRLQGPVSPPGARFTPRPPPGDDVAAYVSQSISSAPTATRPASSSTLPLRTSPSTPPPPPDGWKLPAGALASCTPAPTPSTNSSFMWPSRASTSKFLTHPSSSRSCTPWQNASASPPTPPNGGGVRRAVTGLGGDRPRSFKLSAHAGVADRSSQALARPAGNVRGGGQRITDR
jgi:hypothetical protein